MTPQLWKFLKRYKGALLASLLLMILSRGAALVLPLSVRYLIDDVMNKRQLALLPRLLTVVLLATFLQAICVFLVNLTLAKTSERMIAEMRVKVQEHVSRLPVAFFDNHSKGTLTARIMKDVVGIRNFFGTGAVNSLGAAVGVLGALTCLLALNARITVPTLALMGGFVWIQRRYSGSLRPAYRESARFSAGIEGRLTQSLSGVRVVKAYAAEQREALLFGRGADRIAENSIRVQTSLSRLSMMSSIAVFLGTPLMLYLASGQVAQGRMSTGQFAAYLALLTYAVTPARQIGELRAAFAEAFAALDRTNELLDEPQEGDEPSRNVTLGPLLGEIRFRDVTFAYEPGKPVLSAVNFDALPGRMTALVGASGAGKSTICSLLCGFYAPTSGVVTIDGIDLSQVQLASYRAQVGVVFQEPFLFSGSIRDNVLFARPAAMDEEVLEACRLSHVSEFANSFPQGYDTLIGERGVKLSGGQQQRLCMARAFLVNPRILILDEATSSLDAESEAMIQKSLKQLVEHRTTIVIAHRLSTIKAADEILVMDKGQIVERGNHQALLQLKGRYFDLYSHQSGVSDSPDPWPERIAAEA